MVGEKPKRWNATRVLPDYLVGRDSSADEAGGENSKRGSFQLHLLLGLSSSSPGTRTGTAASLGQCSSSQVPDEGGNCVKSGQRTGKRTWKGTYN